MSWTAWKHYWMSHTKNKKRGSVVLNYGGVSTEAGDRFDRSPAYFFILNFCGSQNSFVAV